MAKPNMTLELFVTGGFRSPMSGKICLKIIMKETKVITCSKDLCTNCMTAHGYLRQTFVV